MTIVIELRHISKSFKKHNVLEDISINIKNNCCTALIGKNGAGKSTLIDIHKGLRIITFISILLSNVYFFSSV